MGAPDLVRFNNRVVSAKSCLFTLLDGIPFKDVTATDYGDELDIPYIYGAQRDGTPIGQGSGKYSPGQLVVTMLNDTFRKKFMPALAALNTAVGSPGSLGVADFACTFQYLELPLPPDIDVVTGCRVRGIKDTYQEGVDGLVTVITMAPMSLSRNGFTLYDRTRDLP